MTNFESFLPRSQTCPILVCRQTNSGSSSPKAPSGREIRGPWTKFSATPSKQHHFLNFVTSTPALAIAMFIYAIIFVVLPLSVDRQTLSYEQRKDSLNGQLPSPRSLLSNRRMAMHVGDGDDFRVLEDETPLYSVDNPASLQQPWVEYKESGNVIYLDEALDTSIWQDGSLYHQNKTVAVPPQHIVGGNDVRPAWCPKGDIRLFIAITSRCCVPKAQTKRDMIRQTWLKDVMKHPNIFARFILSQPSNEDQKSAALEVLPREIKAQGDIVFLPGLESYHLLPEKTLRLMKYALSSPCNFTHILKTDDDVFLRPEKLMSIIETGQHSFEIDIPASPNSSTLFDGRQPKSTESPWMSGMYVGQLDSNKTGVYPGWTPNRDVRNKWYLSEDDLPDSHVDSLLGVRWISGWGYLLSRDVAEVADSAASRYASQPSEAPKWWGRMPWEDILIAALLENRVTAHHHAGFKSAWDECDEKTVLKHLDWDAPSLLTGLQAQQENGLWDRKSVVCSSGEFKPGNYTEWRAWRNSLPDNQATGLM